MPGDHTLPPRRIRVCPTPSAGRKGRGGGHGTGPMTGASPGSGQDRKWPTRRLPDRRHQRPDRLPVGDERAAVKGQFRAVRAAFSADPVRGHNGHKIGRGVALHGTPPVAGAVVARHLRLGSDGRWIKQHLVCRKLAAPDRKVPLSGLMHRAGQRRGQDRCSPGSRPVAEYDHPRLFSDPNRYRRRGTSPGLVTTRTGDEKVMNTTIGIDISKDHLDAHPG